MDELIEYLGISQDMTTQGSKYVVALDDSNDFARMYTKLDNYDKLELYDGSLSLQEELSNLVYSNDHLIVHLIGDFIKDSYVLTLEEV